MITRSVDENGDVCYRNEQGQLHREDGPAVERADGTREWYLNDQHYAFSKWLEHANLSNTQKVCLVLQYTDYV